MKRTTVLAAVAVLLAGLGMAHQPPPMNRPGVPPVAPAPGDGLEPPEREDCVIAESYPVQVICPGGSDLDGPDKPVGYSLQGRLDRDTDVMKKSPGFQGLGYGHRSRGLSEPVPDIQRTSSR